VEFLNEISRRFILDQISKVSVNCGEQHPFIEKLEIINLIKIYSKLNK
jgi:hypothetical protein